MIARLSGIPVIVVSAALALAFTQIGCGSKDKKTDEAMLPSAGNGKVPKVDPTLCETEGKQVTTYDLNRDNRPDVWKLFKEIEEGGARLRILSCKQIDFDHDGKKDYVVAYDKRGAKIFEKLDRDFDGRFDIFYQFDAKSGKVVEAQFESGFDGRYDIQKVYNEDGGLKSVRGDRNGDGKPDVWEQYVKGKLVAILYDDDYDSKVDRRDEIEVEDEDEGENKSGEPAAEEGRPDGQTDGDEAGDEASGDGTEGADDGTEGADDSGTSE